jgi:hypothetical protein
MLGDGQSDPNAIVMGAETDDVHEILIGSSPVESVSEGASRETPSSTRRVWTFVNISVIAFNATGYRRPSEIQYNTIQRNALPHSSSSSSTLLQSCIDQSKHTR